MTYLYAPVNKAYIFILRHILTNWQRSTKNMRSNHVGTQERVIYQPCADREGNRGIRTPNLGTIPPPFGKFKLTAGYVKFTYKITENTPGLGPTSSGIQSYHQTPYLGVGVPIMSRNLIKHYTVFTTNPSSLPIPD